MIAFQLREDINMMKDQDYVEDYLGYHQDGANLSDVRFVFSDTSCRIHQPIDDEEDDKYDISRDQVDPSLWDEFVATFS
jgi:hypothetical protein